MSAVDHDIPYQPVSIGAACRAVVSECVRKWAAGAALDERERQIVDDALALNKLDMIQAVFADREADHAER